MTITLANITKNLGQLVTTLEKVLDLQGKRFAAWDAEFEKLAVLYETYDGKEWVASDKDDCVRITKACREYSNVNSLRIIHMEHDSRNIRGQMNELDKVLSELIKP